MPAIFDASAPFARTRVYPNGECVVFRDRIKKQVGPSRYEEAEPDSYIWAAWQIWCKYPELRRRYPFLMGLSLVQNFDSLSEPLPDKVSPGVKATKRYGLNGITRRGARTVRNAAHLLQKSFGRGRLTFATVTVPSLPMNQLRIVHENWNVVVERYRIIIKRALEKKNLPTYLLSVSEIQTKRHKKTGIPVLHLHSLWVGRDRYGLWGVTAEMHDNAWRNAIQAVIPGISVSFKSAANLQSVKSSAAGYLGKYMSKGGAAIEAVKNDGFGDWLPRQWWNCDRELVRWVDRETLEGTAPSELLLSASDMESKEVWEFVGHILIDIGERQQYWLATYGRLSTSAAQMARDMINLTKPK